MRDHENARTDGGHTPARSPAAGSRTQPRGLEALQGTVGNAAVVQMLRKAGLSGAQAGAPEEHRHGADRGHQQPAVQRSAVHDVLRSSGRPLDEATRTDMEDRLGADFSDVRIHSDAAARASAAEVGARAYTSGSHVVIGEGGGDRHTLAHELTHVIQQRQGPVAGTDNGSGLSISDPSDRFEREAEANATRALSTATQVQRSREHGTAAITGGPGVAVQRVDKEKVDEEAGRPGSGSVTRPSVPEKVDEEAGRPGSGSDTRTSAPEKVDEEAGRPGSGSVTRPSVPEKVDEEAGRPGSGSDTRTSAPEKVDEEAGRPGSGSDTRTSAPDKDHLEKVSKDLAGQKPSNLSEMGKILTATVLPAPAPGKRPGRSMKLSQIGRESLDRLYTENPAPTEDPEWHWEPQTWPILRAEVEAVYAYLSARVRLSDGGGLMHSKSDKQWLMVKPPMSPTRQARSSAELKKLPFYESPVTKPAPGSATPDQVLLGDGTAMTRGATYGYDSPGGTTHRMITYAKDMPDAIPDFSLPSAAGVAPTAALGRGLLPVTSATKAVGPVTVDRALLNKWGGGKREGHKPDQNTAMKGVSASEAAKKSGLADGDWQWLHLIAFTMGGHDGEQPNAPENLAAGLAAANGHHLVLETLIKRMVLQADIPEVEVSATAHMLPDTYHVCSDIDYVLKWSRDGKTYRDNFKINALNPNKSMGGHLALLYEQYVLNHP